LRVPSIFRQRRTPVAKVAFELHQGRAIRQFNPKPY
jgi:hypothetical protein